jgi:decaprenyl-phosphate phosphoribosyltransferase
VLARTLRVKQWLKNVLIFAAPAAAGVLFERAVFVDTVTAFFSFSLIASFLYIVNDVRDLEADRRHPRKSKRPLAAGEISVNAGVVVATAALVAGIALATLLPIEFAAVLLAYGANTLAYTAAGKHIATVDMLQVALGFVLRAVAGGMAADVDVSQWFLGVAMFGSLLMVAGKRSSEVRSLGNSSGTRSVLRSYTPEFLGQVTTLAAGATVLTYALWALGDPGSFGSPWALLSLGPVVYAVLRYLQLSDAGSVEEPELLVLHEPGLMIAASTWVALAGLGIYA